MRDRTVPHFLAGESRQGRTDPEAIEAARSLSLVRGLAAGKADPCTFPTWTCPAGHETAYPSGIVPERPQCFDCESARWRAQQDRLALARLGKLPEELPRVFQSRDAALLEHGVPSRHLFDFRPINWPRAEDAEDSDAPVYAWTGEREWCLALIGDIESGKTAMATEIFWRRLPHVRTAYWYRAGKLVRALYGNYGQEEKEKALERCASDLLLLDDIAWEVQGGAVEALLGVIADRNDNMQPTLLTLNKGLSWMYETNGAMARRIAEGLIVPCLGNWRDRVIQGGAR